MLTLSKLLPALALGVGLAALTQPAFRADLAPMAPVAVSAASLTPSARD